MTTQELYDLMSKGFDDIKTTLTSIDNRLRNVENDVAELKGRRLAFKEWIPIGCAVIAVIVNRSSVTTVGESRDNGISVFSEHLSNSVCGHECLLCCLATPGDSDDLRMQW